MVIEVFMISPPFFPPEPAMKTSAIPTNLPMSKSQPSQLQSPEARRFNSWKTYPKTLIPVPIPIHALF